MRETTPQVELIARPSVDLEALGRYLKTVGGESWLERRLGEEGGSNPGQLLVEAAGRACFDDQTDILTANGWKRFAELEVGQEVATLNRHTLLLEYQPVLACWRYSYVGNMYEVEARDVSFSVTPEHRLWASLRTLRDAEREVDDHFAPFRFHTAETIGRSSLKVMTAADGWKGMFPDRIVIPDVHWSQRLADGTASFGERHSVSKGRVLHDPAEIWALARLLVYYVTEGSVIDRPGSGRGLVIYGGHEQGVRDACVKLGLAVSTSRDSRNGVKRIRVTGGLPLVRYVADKCGIYSRNKRLPRWILDLPPEQLQEVWNLLVETDGSISNGRKKLTTISPALIDDCQEILAKLGRATSVVDGGDGSRNVFEKLPRPATINRAGRTRMRRIPYDGEVFCCTTENGIVLVRRRGLVHFSGNCYRSWEPGLNPNVTKVRTDAGEYFLNIMRSGHGSVLEHANYTFVLSDVSRVFCYDEETEVLTSEGWIPWPKVQGDETFGTLNPATGELEYQRATEHFVGEYEGPMYRVRSEQVDLLVTPNHRMWVQKYDTQAAKRKEEPYRVYPAEEIVGKRVKYQKTARWRGEEPDWIELPATTRKLQFKNGPRIRHYPGISVPARPFARFLGYYLSEGSINRHLIVLYQNRGPVMDKMVRTVEEMGLHPYVVPEPHQGQVRTCNTALRDFLADLGSTAYEKRIPAMVQDWSPSLIREFLLAMVEGDGSSRPNGGHQVIYTSSSEMADDLQVLAIKAGWSANVRIDDRTGMKRTLKTGQVFHNRRPCYIVSLVKVRTRPLVNHNRSKNDGFVDYSGRIYCVKVPNGLLFVRRNGKPCVSSNTHELVRHRAGSAFSQESMRFVRIKDMGFRIPDSMESLRPQIISILETLEEFQISAAEHFGLDEEGVNFHTKKEITSALRRLAPDGISTMIIWTANVRTLRHVIQARTDPGAEEELRLVFNRIGEIMKEEAPLLFADFVVTDGAWTTEYRKV